MDNSLGRRISELRERRGLSITQLAKLAGVSKSTLWDIENGKIMPTITTLWSIANALGVTFGELAPYDIVIKDGGIEVRLIERGHGREVYLMKLSRGGYRRAAPHGSNPLEEVYVVDGAMVAGCVESPQFIWRGKRAVFNGGLEHIYLGVAGETVALVIMRYGERFEESSPPARRAAPHFPRYRDLIDDVVSNELLSDLVRAVNTRHRPEHESLAGDILTAELETLSGRLAVPRVVVDNFKKVKEAGIERGSSTFESNIDAVRYFIYEPLHPGYAEQVVYVAYELYRRGVDEVVSVGCGPGIHEAALREILGIEILCIEPAAVFRALSGYKTVDEIPSGASAVISFGASHHIPNFLREVGSRLREGGILIVSDEFIGEHHDERSRALSLIQHHLTYLLDIPIKCCREALESAYFYASRGRLRPALAFTAKAYIEVYEKIGDLSIGVEEAFLNFFYLELSALLLGVANIEERKTSVARFIDEAAEHGLRLLSHYKVYSTGPGKWGSGTHVLVFKKV
ncbi:helix-turn-helix domain-containing protein [Pyrobaculum sp. 3827-6]|uniref:DNA (cytosine-5-)-methyltransferase n=1 Tax=Pyrobaculum sp. 3827-6 TaxID=2983604 RepID=UPI0021D83471|nr:DNA (cytosine-5-)-methyltransferase [Pyrobaculum sp. 3827-6]MCU7786390.1 helix-turn-helix domain-containing protein [Pyrobaculum sp. 3827-6]